jgi:hypothetical protein
MLAFTLKGKEYAALTLGERQGISFPSFKEG